jgi:endoglucanase
MNKNALMTGINLGGWISQYPSLDHEHFKSFITAADIDRIAAWGFDHVRLPVDYPVIEDDANPGVLKEDGMAYIESCLGWCAKHDMPAILDLHKAPGFAFDEHGKADLFNETSLQDRFINLWKLIAHRYAGRLEDELAFELLNEITLPDSSPWNALVKKTVAAIREIDPSRLIVIGGNYYNSASELKNLDLPADENILYTFHFYLPLSVTHQKAPWIQVMVEYNRTVNYPGEKAVGLEKVVNETTHMFGDELNVVFDKEYLRRLLMPAVEFARKIGQPVYCGEFGVYEVAPMATRLNWTRDFVELLKEYNLGHALWSYKALDFGLVDKTGNVVNEELVKIAVMR